MSKFHFTEIENKLVWDSFIKTYAKTVAGIPRITFMQSFEWGELQRSLGQEIIRIGILDNSNKLIGVGFGNEIRAKRGSYLHFRHGPMLDYVNEELFLEFVKFVKSYAKAKGLWFVRFSPLLEVSTSEENFISSQKWLKKIPINEVEGLDNWIMDLKANNIDELFQLIKKKTRYEIRKADQECEVLITQDEKYIDDFYEIELDTVARNDWKAFSKDFTLAEFKHFAKYNNADIILIKYNGEFIAGGIFIHYGGQTYYHYGASLSKYRNIPAGYLVIWEAIKLAYERKHTHFNFWGIAPENSKPKHPWYGLTSFKKKFPGTAIHWMHARDIIVSPKYYLTHFFEKIERIKKGF